MSVQNNQIYTGLNALPVYDLYAQMFLETKDPTSANYTTRPYRNFQIGTFWLNTTNQNLWYLADIQTTPKVEGNWVLLSGGISNIETLTGNSGGAVAPLVGNINVVGDGVGITIVGNPTTHTLTASLVGGGVATQSYITSPATGTATPNAAGQLTFAGAGGIVVSAAANTVTITGGGSISESFPTDSGTATPAAGVLNILTQNATLGCGSTVLFSAPGPSNTVQLNVTDSRFNTIIGNLAGNLTMGALSSYNVGLGLSALSSLETIGGDGGAFNIGVGAYALTNCTTGTGNTALGHIALSGITTGANNLAFGTESATALTTGNNNITIGNGSATGPRGPLGQLVTGSYNTAIGCATDSASTGAGWNYTGAESSNIVIGPATVGVTGESNVIRLGTTGTGNGEQNKCFIAGIRGVTTTNADAVAVLIDSAGQLGTISSSARYKENIQSMNGDSDAIMALRPVTFNYKKHEAKDKQYGLIAEEVDKVLPELVVYDELGEPDTIKYQHLPVMLLNELQIQKKQIVDLMAHVGILEQEVMQLKARRK